MITNIEAIRHLDDVIAQYEEMYRSRPSAATDAQHREIYVRLRAAVFRLAPKDSEYEQQGRSIDKYNKMTIKHQSDELVGIARSLRRDFNGGFISASFAALVRAELFEDFLEMCDHLLSAGYKDPAAVVGGAVLEEHLRRLCLLNGVPTLDKGKARKADSLNSDLAGKTIYSKLDQKSVTAWLDLRNKAAHGHFADYVAAQVELMLKGIGDFVARFPA